MFYGVIHNAVTSGIMVFVSICLLIDLNNTRGWLSQKNLLITAH